jgi:DNA-binding NtrC family response regulator
VDDDPVARKLLAGLLGSGGIAVEPHACGASLVGSDLLSLDFVCVDLGLGAESGLDLIATIRGLDPELPVIVVTAARSLETAVEAMRAGAWDYLAKPVDPSLLAQAARRASERRTLTRDVQALRERLAERSGLERILGRSERVKELRRQIARVLQSDVNVFVSGESGTGKELVARALHDAGRRRQGPFVAHNCGAIPAALQESELFGHERGAFTGATATHKGRFEQAHGGTLFLDEIAEMSAATQASLLRTIQERTVRRVGAAHDLSIDVRIVCATHRDLEVEVAAGRFRQDLFYRLVVYPIRVPPLRERLEDLPLLVGHFLRRFAGDVPRPIARVTPAMLDALAQHDWPGNVRELENVVHRAMLSSEGDVLDVASLPESLRAMRCGTRPALDLTQGVSEEAHVVLLATLERDAISRALAREGGNVTRAARLLGLGRATVSPSRGATCRGGSGERVVSKRDARLGAGRACAVKPRESAVRSLAGSLLHQGRAHARFQSE